MKSLAASLAAFLALIFLSTHAFADARSERANEHVWGQRVAIYAPTRAPNWRHGAPAMVARAAVREVAQVYATSSALVAEAARYVGSGKFTSLPGAWCADAVNVWLRATGHAPLASRMAGAALSYGPRGSGAPGDLAVFMGRRGAYHVGVVVASLGDRVEVVSGNCGRRVGRAFVSRRSLIFVRT